MRFEVLTIQNHGALRLKQKIDRILLRQNLLTHFVHIFQQTDIRLDEDVFPARVDPLALGNDTIRCWVRTTDEINRGILGLLRERLESVFTYAAGGADKYSYHACWQAGCDSRV